MNHSYETVYGVQLFDDLHNYLPDILYNHRRFHSVQGLLDYVSQQTRSHFNLFDRGQRLYGPQQPNLFQTIAPRRMNITTTETVDLTPMMTIPLNGLPRTLGRQQDDTLANLLGLLLPGAGGAAGGAAGGMVTMEDVLVAPTFTQIESATSLSSATDEQGEDRCSICQECFTVGQVLRTIHHCEHEFHRACIDRWFQQNVHCPVCRFDIRDHQATPSAEEDA